MAKRKKFSSATQVPKFFSGYFEMTLDDASRMSIPAPFIDILKAHHSEDNLKVTIMPSYSDFIAIYPKDVFEGKLLPLFEKIDDFDEESRNLKFFIFSLIDCQDIDSHGRIKFGQKLLSNAQIETKSVVLVGFLDHFEVMNRSSFDKITYGVSMKRSVSNCLGKIVHPEVKPLQNTEQKIEASGEEKGKSVNST